MDTLQELVFNLATSKKKTIDTKTINEAADKLNISRSRAQRAWKNYSQLDVKNEKFSRRYKDGSNVGKYTKVQSIWQKENVVTVSRKVYFKTAAKIILQIKNTDAKVFEVLKSYRIPKTQYYEWLEELNISGRLLGRTIFDWTQYPKKDVKEVIRFSKYPEKYIGRNVLETAQLNRLSTVLDEYLK